MPLFESEATPRGRLRVFVRAQLPLLLSTGFVGLVVAAALPSALSGPVLQLGFAIIVVASIAAAALPWERTVPTALVTVAVADLVGVALIRAELLAALPSVGMLAIFPILWLAYGFRRIVVLLAIAGALFITSFGFAYQGTWPTTSLEWANVVTLPALIVGVALVVNSAASQLRRNRERLIVANARQADALRRSQDNELLSRAILDTVSAGVAFYDADNELVIANRPAEALVEVVGFRLDQPPYAGDRVLAADRTTTIPYDQQIIPRALRGEEISNHVEWLGPPEQQIAIMASSRQAHRPDGGLLGTVIVAYDITELAQAIAIREEFLSTVSHELRTPLTSVTGYLELLEDSLDPADAASIRYLEVVSRNVHTLQDRIADLLVDTDAEGTMRVAPVDVDSVVDAAVAATTESAQRRHQLVEIRREGGTGSPVAGDASALRHAVAELIENAVKFSPEGSRITVTQSAGPADHTITVEDRGVGLSRGEQAQMFDRFYRTNHARTNAVQGFGLGLAQVKATVERHGGRLSVASAAGRGSRISLTIPTSSELSGVSTAAPIP